MREKIKDAFFISLEYLLENGWTNPFSWKCWVFFAPLILFLAFPFSYVVSKVLELFSRFWLPILGQ